MSSHDMDVYGECQLEVDFVDESDLQERFNSCAKNPNHTNFVSLKSLKFDDLPEYHRKNWAFHYIQLVAQFTVKLTVDFISPGKPCTCGNNNSSEDTRCKCPRGNLRHVGSGFVTGLAGPDQLKSDVIDATKTYFILVTAAHVIFDTSEAQKTEIEFFYDDPDDRSSVRKARGVEVLNTNFEADFSEILCVTEDKEIVEILNNLKLSRPENVLDSKFLKEILDKIVYAIYHEDEEACKSLLNFMRIKEYSLLIYCLKKLFSMYSSNEQLQEDKASFFDAILDIIITFIRRPLHPGVIECAKLIEINDKYFHEQELWYRLIFSNEKLKYVFEEVFYEDLAIHISHPHGTSKTVTFGNIVSADTRHGHYQLIYSLDTCKGSSGGPVFVIPSNYQLRSIYCVPHSRHHGDNLNSSSSWTEYF